MKKKLMIEGMSCGHCVNHTKEALQELEGVTVLEVSLEEGFALVEGETLNDQALTEAVDEVGYKVTSISTL